MTALSISSCWSTNRTATREKSSTCCVMVKAALGSCDVVGVAEVEEEVEEVDGVVVGVVE